ncbi:MAG: DUF2335 domain-containing protein [Deltaproteobacteria bacterium]|nr:DUF2335 domain-containing protein [Deltaproteobacteria bacterium]
MNNLKAEQLELQSATILGSDSEEEPNDAMMASFGMRYQGPLPPPAMMAGYENISPGFADRILKMAENEQSHRHSEESKLSSGYLKHHLVGQLLGAGLGISCVIAGVLIAILANSPTVGAALSGSGAVALVGAFMYGKSKDTKQVETQDKKQIEEDKKTQKQENKEAH